MRTLGSRTLPLFEVLSVGGLLAALALVPSSARADAQAQTMVLPPELSGGAETWAQAFYETLTKKVGGSTVTVMAPARLAEGDRTCHDPPCLGAILNRPEFQKFDVIVAARVNGDGKAAPDYYLTVYVYDRAKPGYAPRQDKVCRGCTKEQTAEMLAAFERDVLGLPPDESIAVGTGGTGGTGDGPGAGGGGGGAGEPGGGGRRKLWLGLAGGSAALALGSAALMVVELLRNGQDACTDGKTGDACIYQRDTTVGIIVGAIGTGVFAAGAAGLYLLSRREGRAAAATSFWILPATDGRSVGLGVIGRF